MKGSATSECWLVYEKETGAVCYRFESGAGVAAPVGRLSAILAMHCFLRDKQPDNFAVLEARSTTELDRVPLEAAAVIAEVRGLKQARTLTVPQARVLQGIAEYLSDKEIASRLNVSKSTVKFHVSGLLRKFGAADRHVLRLITEESTKNKKNETGE